MHVYVGLCIPGVGEGGGGEARHFSSLMPSCHLLSFFCLMFAMPLCASVCLCLVITCWERADLLALVCGV